MPQQLVVTAIGTDRTGIVSQLARLVTDCNCNIVDSRMAIFGNEFTFIMLLSGDAAAISKIEYLLPSSAFELDLLTMSKRTSSCTLPTLSAPYIVEYTGVDRVGTLGAISSLRAYGAQYDAATRDELLTTAQEESERMNRFIGNLLDMTRLDAVARSLLTVAEAEQAAEYDRVRYDVILVDDFSKDYIAGQFGKTA